MIPTTSQFDTEYPGEFSVGQLTGLPTNNTILQVHKMMNISRKRIVPWHGNYVVSRIGPAHMERIFHAIAILYNGEISLDSFVYGNPTVGVMLPDNLTQFEAMRFWPIRDMQVNPTNHLLAFRKWNETTPHSLQLKVPNQMISMNIKKDIWKNFTERHRTAIVPWQCSFIGNIIDFLLFSQDAVAFRGMPQYNMSQSFVRNAIPTTALKKGTD